MLTKEQRNFAAPLLSELALGATPEEGKTIDDIALVVCVAPVGHDVEILLNRLDKETRPVVLDAIHVCLRALTYRRGENV